MKPACFRVLTCLAALLAAVSAPAGAPDLTGTWKFPVDLENGEHGEPVFVLKQVGDQLTGVYQGPFGKQKVTGNIQGDTVTLEVKASGLGRTLKLSYTGKVEDADKMSGTMTRNISWRARLENGLRPGANEMRGLLAGKRRWFLSPGELVVIMASTLGAVGIGLQTPAPLLSVAEGMKRLDLPGLPPISHYLARDGAMRV